MELRRQLQSEIARHIKGIENVHSIVSNPDKLGDIYSALFGPAKHRDANWSEFEIGGMDIAVAGGGGNRSVVTILVEDLVGLHSLLCKNGFAVVDIVHGEYGDYTELAPEEGIVFHFFEPKKKCPNLNQ